MVVCSRRSAEEGEVRRRSDFGDLGAFSCERGGVKSRTSFFELAHF